MTTSSRQRQDEISDLIEKNKQTDFFTTKTPNDWPPKGRLLILDSSFNPPTHAHLNLLRKASEAYSPGYFNASLLLFSINNADKKLTGASVVQRVQMMELVSGDMAAVGCTTYGRFVDKATAIRSQFPGTELYFIVGYDTMVRLLDPKYYETTVQEALQPFFHHCRLVCADREPFDEHVWADIQTTYGDLIQRIRLDSHVAALSSTEARKAIHSNDRPLMESIMPPIIVDYLENTSIYQ
jgi:nicotinamide-nucleotide adenylyltransferase